MESSNGKGDKRRSGEDLDKYRESYERIFADKVDPPKDDDPK